MIKILFFGDIFGRPGREAVKKVLSELKKQYSPDLIIANAENLAHGKGVTRLTIAEMREAGIDLFTGGNHIFHREDAPEVVGDLDLPIIRPLNYPDGVPGEGFKIIEINPHTFKGVGVNGAKILVFNLLGRVFMKENTNDPFLIAQKILDDNRDVKISILDFHAEATSEKIALKHYLDGKISAILGTHTHIPTADWKITASGTAYVSDIGMCGPTDSVIGLDKNQIIKQYLSQIPQKKIISENGETEINAIYLEIDDNSGKTTKIEKIFRVVEKTA